MRTLPGKTGSGSCNQHRSVLRLELLETRDLPSVTPLAPSIMVVHPGDNIQSVIDSARPGTTILIEPGIYQQTITVSTPNLSLVGIVDSQGNEPILESPVGADTGVTVAAAGPLNGF